MQSAEAVAAKRKILIDALTMCLSRSKVKDVVPLDTIRSILQSASGELWREGEFRLEMVWKILCQQPGLAAQDVAPPLLVFKSFEQTLGVHVRMPQALTAIPRAEQQKLREQLTITQEDFAQAIEQMSAVDSSAEPASHADVAKQAVDAAAPEPKKPRKPATLAQKILASAFAALALAGVGVSVMLTFRDSTTDADVADVAPILQLTDAKRLDRALAARINDPRWDGLGRDEQRRIAQQLFDKERDKGIRSITLTDAKGRVRVGVSNLTGETVLVIH
jgi:hypothetical protein